MIIRTGMISGYLRYITSIELVDVDDPIEDMSLFDSVIDAMADDATRDGNLDWLQYAIDSLVSDPMGRVSAFFGDGYPFSEEDLAAVLAYAYGQIWPDEQVSGPGEAIPVDFVRMTAEEWAAVTSAS